jgi:hypothetical protein
MALKTFQYFPMREACFGWLAKANEEGFLRQRWKILPTKFPRSVTQEDAVSACRKQPTKNAVPSRQGPDSNEKSGAMCANEQTAVNRRAMVRGFVVNTGFFAYILGLALTEPYSLVPERRAKSALNPHDGRASTPQSTCRQGINLGKV